MSTERENAIAIALRVVGGEIARECFKHLPSCVNCLHFDQANEVCVLANQRPPARVIAFGCPSFDDMPF